MAVNIIEGKVINEGMKVGIVCARFNEFITSKLLGGALLVAKPISELSKWAPIVAAALSSLYGVTDEFHQIFTPGRSCDPMDWLVDTIAAALGALICYLVLKAQRARR